jgi:hypothetical protein
MGAQTLTALLCWALWGLRGLCGRLGWVYGCAMLCDSCTSDRDWGCRLQYSTLLFSDLACRCLCIVRCRHAKPALLCDKPAAIVWL